MATWFLATAWGQWLAAFAASLANTQTVGGKVLDPSRALDTSLHVFMQIGTIGVAAGVLFLIGAPFLTRLANVVPNPDASGD
jgi:POT family proton-dependent oligopeptide transporter